jgi:hypothetical protein
MNENYKWHEVYKAALLETEWSKMAERIRKAEGVIEDRKRELAQNRGRDFRGKRSHRGCHSQPECSTVRNCFLV